MLILAHLAGGLLVEKLTSHYLLAVLSALLPDMDHIIVYIWEGVLFSWKRFWKVVLDNEDKLGH